jgi:septal ring factor EnvC (AmiA/AmiB activator)
VSQDISRLIGRLEQSAEDMREDISRLETQLAALHTTLNNLMPKLEQAAKHASDWEVTKRRGMLYLAAAGATGMASTLGLQKIGPLVFAILK